ncbi:MAG TPA: response regulator [Candidatus Dormibacteraeota bacterium]|nr:response regulator [Candidatus Dormibacteraeota bacterium]
MTILVVEDSPDDVFFLKRALTRTGTNVSVQVAEDGQAAIDYFKGEGAFANRGEFPFPRLVLLDLRIPRVPGFEVLRWLRSKGEFGCIPVVVFSSSREDSDMRKAYALGANSFLVKTGDTTQLSAMVKAMVEYWLKYNEVPSICASDTELSDLSTTA